MKGGEELLPATVANSIDHNTVPTKMGTVRHRHAAVVNVNGDAGHVITDNDVTANVITEDVTADVIANDVTANVMTDDITVEVITADVTAEVITADVIHANVSDACLTTASKTAKRVAVVGAGLVGTLEACIMAQRGYDVHLYEARPDIRTLEHVSGRSINLAMSVRGRSALAKIGVEDEIIAHHAIPMKGRLIHEKDGSTRVVPYNKDGQCIYSVSRRYVNEVLLNRAQELSTVTCHFEHRLTGVDLHKGHMTFANTATGQTTLATADLVLACDGAYSMVRREMLKQTSFNYAQHYIPHGYMELCIPAGRDGQFAMPHNYLHIWPREEFMMIALPNQDHTWTVTLFMPFCNFERLNTQQKILAFFEENFPDAVPLVGKEKLVQDFLNNKAQSMISVKCSPYHIGATLLMGDAAHAMVPFYGQGMNCGMEDCLVLDELLQQNNDNIELSVAAFSKIRNPDAEAIVDLATYNYLEMRNLVNTWRFFIRKKVDNLLYTLLPTTWIPLYTMVTFTREPYHRCMDSKHWQDKMLWRGVMAAILVAVVSTALCIT